MNKLLSFSFICITSSLLFYSCSSHLAITKRHFNKGYYVTHSNGPQNPSLLKEEKTVQTSQQLSLDSTQNQSKSNTIAESPEKYQWADNTALAANNKKLPRKAISRNNIKKALKQIVKIPENNTAKIKSSYSENKITGSDSSTGDELSLL